MPSCASRREMVRLTPDGVYDGGERNQGIDIDHS
jgi:hypothetical protein